MTSRVPATYWTAREAAASLNELAYFERAAAHVLAGWLPKIAALEVKVELAQHLYQAINRATQLQRRLLGLTRAHADEPPVALGWQTVMARVDAAPDVTAMLDGLYRVVWPRVTALYRRHLTCADPIGDSGSLRVITSALSEIEAQDAWAQSAHGSIGRTPAARAFLQDLESLWEIRSAGRHLAASESLWQPLKRLPAALRAPELLRGTPGSLGLIPTDTVNDPVGVGMFLHADLDEEYTTLELMARNSYEHPDMPWQFHLDMARQVSDEARHALLVSRLMADRGFAYGDFAINTTSYDALYAFAPCEPGSRKELLWRMLLRQTFMEGLALDSFAHEVSRRAAAGQHDIAHAFDYILRDEVFHAESGLRWCRHIIGDDPRAVLQERYEALTYFSKRMEAVHAEFVETNLELAMGELIAIEEGKRRRGGLPARPINLVGRRQASFSDEDIQQILDWGYATR